MDICTKLFCLQLQDVSDSQIHRAAHSVSHTVSYAKGALKKKLHKQPQKKKVLFLWLLVQTFFQRPLATPQYVVSGSSLRIGLRHFLRHILFVIRSSAERLRDSKTWHLRPPLARKGVEKMKWHTYTQGLTDEQVVSLTSFNTVSNFSRRIKN